MSKWILGKNIKQIKTNKMEETSTMVFNRNEKQLRFLAELNCNVHISDAVRSLAANLIIDILAKVNNLEEVIKEPQGDIR